MREYKKPPLGVMPRFIWEEKRIQELKEAIDRYLDADFIIPVEWIEEYREHITRRNERLEERKCRKASRENTEQQS